MPGAPRRGLIYLPRCIANFTTNLLYSLQVQWICTVQLKAPAKSLLLHSQDKWGPVLVTLAAGAEAAAGAATAARRLHAVPR